MLIDISLGIKNQATVILYALQEYNDMNLYSCPTKTIAWYNGRERGIALMVASPSRTKQLNITFGEERRSDCIFVDAWEADYNSEITVKDFTEEGYKNRRSFDCLDIKSATAYIISTITQFISEFKK